MNSVEQEGIIEEIAEDFREYRGFERARACATRYARHRIASINQELGDDDMPPEAIIYRLQSRSCWVHAIAESQRGKWRELRNGILLEARDEPDPQVRVAMERLGESIKPVIISFPQMQRLRQRASR